MTRFGRLFGKKTDKSPFTEQPISDASLTTAPEGLERSSEQDFGLKFIFDNGEARTFTQLPIRIGRAEQNDFVLNDDSVSANHALVFFDDRLREVCILDLDSLNGITIADGPTRKNVLQDGARIGIGSTHLIFRDTGYIHPA